jgi:hypothetical protein
LGQFKSASAHILVVGIVRVSQCRSQIEVVDAIVTTDVNVMCCFLEPQLGQLKALLKYKYICADVLPDVYVEISNPLLFQGSKRAFMLWY